MAAKEAQSRIKINKLLEEAGWRFFDSCIGKANIILEPNIKLVGKHQSDFTAQAALPFAIVAGRRSCP